jgi:hypothetical protein
MENSEPGKAKGQSSDQRIDHIMHDIFFDLIPLALLRLDTTLHIF